MANLPVWAAVVPNGVETTSGVSSSIDPLTTMVMNDLGPMFTEGSLTRWSEDGQCSLVDSVENVDMQPHVGFWSTGITRLVFRIVPIGFFPRIPSFTNLSFVNAPDPLTGHSYLLHTLQVFVGTRGLTFVRNVPLPTTNSPNCLSLSVRSFMRRLPTPLHLPASGAQRPPHIHPGNRVRSEGRPRRIRCYRMCSIASGPWCWDATTQAARDDAASQSGGWRGVLSFSCKVRAC